jgi:hypothetical protein
LIFHGFSLFAGSIGRLVFESQSAAT